MRAKHWKYLSWRLALHHYIVMSNQNKSTKQLCIIVIALQQCLNISGLHLQRFDDAHLTFLTRA